MRYRKTGHRWLYALADKEKPRTKRDRDGDREMEGNKCSAKWVLALRFLAVWAAVRADTHMHQGRCVFASFVGGCKCQGRGNNMQCLECHMEYLTLVYAGKMPLLIRVVTWFKPYFKSI